MEVLPARLQLPRRAPHTPARPRRARDVLRRLERETRALDGFHDAFPAAPLRAGQEVRVRLWGHA